MLDSSSFTQTFVKLGSVNAFCKCSTGICVPDPAPRLFRQGMLRTDLYYANHKKGDPMPDRTRIQSIDIGISGIKLLKEREFVWTCYLIVTARWRWLMCVLSLNERAPA